MNRLLTAAAPRWLAAWCTVALVGLATALAIPAGAAPADSPDVHQPYSAERSNPVVYDVEFVVTVTAPYQTKLLRVWLPMPPSDHAQQLLESNLSTFPRTIEPSLHVEPEFGNRFAYFEFPNPQGGQILRHKFRLKAWELRWNLDPAKVQSTAKWPESFAPYLRSEKQAVVVDERFHKLLTEIVPRRGNPLVDLRSVLDWTDRHLAYDHVDASLQASSAHAFEHRRGHCSDFHGFCAALGRVMSQPTRITYGINAFPKSSPSHCKLEAFLPPYGWVSFDVSETQKLAKAIRGDLRVSEVDRDRLIDAAHRRLTSGFRDNTWYLQTRGSDYELAPKASRRVSVVRTIYAEADGTPLADPDPANKSQATYAWMTSHRFDSDVKVPYPFTEVKTLQAWLGDDRFRN